MAKRARHHNGVDVIINKPQTSVSFVSQGTWRVYFNRHGSNGVPWCIAPESGGWELAVASFSIDTYSEGVYRAKATPDENDGCPSAWISATGQLTVLTTGHATIGNP